MMRGQKSGKDDHSDSVDRCSELPEGILHIILSFLNTKDACSASLLSKQWYEAWSSNPVLDFQPQSFEKVNEWFLYSQRYVTFLEFIDKTMERYSVDNHYIWKFKLRLPKIDDKVQSLVDKWIEIAVQNRVQEFDIVVLDEDEESRLRHRYKLPRALLCAKSVKVLKCSRVELPDYQELNMCLLENMDLKSVIVNEDMLQRIVSLCPLIDLNITNCSGFSSISVPWRKKVVDEIRTRDFDIRTSRLKNFVYCCDDYDEYNSLWPWKMNVDGLRNLRKLEILYAEITDDQVSELTSGLAVLETLVLWECFLLRCTKIESISLKKLHVLECKQMEGVIIDAPNLCYFWYKGFLRPALSIIRVHPHCIAHFFDWVDCRRSSEWFINLKKFLIKTNIFEFLDVDVCSSYSDLQMKVKENELRKVDIGLPYKLREIKLRNSYELTEATLSSFVDGLFWSCHPDVLLIPTNDNKMTIRMIQRILNMKAQCRKHPWKSFEVEGVIFSDLHFGRNACEMIKIRFCW